MMLKSLVLCSALAALISFPDVAHAQRSPDALLINSPTASAMGYRLLWQSNLALPPTAKLLHVAALDDLIVTVETGNIVAALVANDGQVLWRRYHAEPLEELTAPKRVGDAIVIASERNAYIQRTDSGELIRKRPLRHVAGTAPVLDGNYAIFGSPSGLIFCEDLNGEVTPWTYKMHGAMLTDPLLVDRSVIVADGAGRVAALNSLTGSVLWLRASPPWGRVSAQPAASESAVFVACEDQALYGFDKATGRNWRHLTQVKLTTPPAVIGDRVFQSVGADLMCFDAFTGDVLWTQPDAAATVLMGLGRNLMLRDGKRVIYRTLADGQAVESFELPDVDVILPTASADGDLIVYSHDGRIARLAPTQP